MRAPATVWQVQSDRAGLPGLRLRHSHEAAFLPRVLCDTPWTQKAERYFISDHDQALSTYLHCQLTCLVKTPFSSFNQCFSSVSRPQLKLNLLFSSLLPSFQNITQSTMDHSDTKVAASQDEQARWEDDIREWEKQGLLAPDQILSRIDKRVQDILSNHLSQHEREHFEQNLDAICDHDDTAAAGDPFVDPVAFADFLAYRSPDHAAPSLVADAAAAPVLFRMLAYLSHYPLAAPPPASPGRARLTRSGLRRAVVHATPRLARFFMDSGNYSRDRTPADVRRLVFQGLAVAPAAAAAAALPAGLALPPPADEARWAAKARQRVLDGEEGDGHGDAGLDDEEEEEEGEEEEKDAVLVNRDGDGDEIYHDVLDFLFSTQPEKSPWYAPCHRDGFRRVARQLRSWSPPLHELVVTRDVIDTLVELALRLDEDEEEASRRLLRKDDIVEGFVGSFGACNFDMFDDACRKHTVSTYHLQYPSVFPFRALLIIEPRRLSKWLSLISCFNRANLELTTPSHLG